MDIKLPIEILDLVKKSDDLFQQMAPLLSEHATNYEIIFKLNDERACIDNQIGRCVRALVEANDKPNTGAIFAPSRFKRK